jgi:hypothetical protein
MAKIIARLLSFRNWSSILFWYKFQSASSTPAVIEACEESNEWDRTLSSENLIVYGKVDPEDGRLQHPHTFVMFERVAVLIGICIASFLPAQTQFTGEIINVDTSTKVITLYERDNGTCEGERMFELQIGPVNWKRFHSILQEGDFLVGNYSERLNPDQNMPFFLLWHVEKIIRPTILYERD